MQLGGPESEGFAIDNCGKEINGIPDAAGLQKAVSTRQYCHCDAARQSALHPRRDRIRANWKPCADLIPLNGQSLHDLPISDEANVFGNHCDSFFLRMRKDGAKP